MNRHRQVSLTAEGHRRRFLKCFGNTVTDDVTKINRLFDILLDMPNDLHQQIQTEYGRKMITISLRTMKGIDAKDCKTFEENMNDAIIYRLKDFVEGDVSTVEKINEIRAMLSRVEAPYQKKELLRQLRPELSECGKRILDYVVKFDRGR